MASSERRGRLAALWQNPAPLVSLPGDEALRSLFWMSSDMWQEKRVHEYLSSRPRLYEAGAHRCEPSLIKIFGARYDAAQDEMQYHCHLGRSALQGRDEVGPRLFWISRQDLLLNPEHALKVELFEANLKSPKLEGQRKKAATTPSPPARRRTAKV
jgi:hypothetical protein